MTQPEPAPETKGWIVEFAVDQRGHGRDFAYTVGLENQGLPEMFIGPEPDTGSWPGGDNAEDRAHQMVTRAQILALLAQGLLTGEVGKGDVITHQVDRGLLAHAWPGDPEPPRGIVAAAFPDSAAVVPVRWSLHPAEPTMV